MAKALTPAEEVAAEILSAAGINWNNAHEVKPNTRDKIVAVAEKHVAKLEELENEIETGADELEKAQDRIADLEEAETALTDVMYWLRDFLYLKRLFGSPQEMLRKVERALGK
jgi:hypothetical protein